MAGVPNKTDTTTFAVYAPHQAIQRVDQTHEVPLHDIGQLKFDKWQLVLHGLIQRPQSLMRVSSLSNLRFQASLQDD